VNDTAALGARFAGARKRLGWTLRDAEHVSGVANAHISQIETGAIRQPGPDVVAKLAKAYGLVNATPQAAIGAAEAALRAFLEPWLTAEVHGTTLESQLRTAAMLALRDAEAVWPHEPPRTDVTG
jgi:transcriptional regulator with XRE-family HTH domain